MEHPSDVSNPTLKIAVLEDNLGDFVLLEDYLIETYQTVQVDHYPNYQAFSTVRTDHGHSCDYDLILLDLHLPDLSGIHLVGEMVGTCSNTPIIILTGYVDLPLAKKGLEMGIDDFLIKDEINVTLLHKSIEFACSRKSYVRQIEKQNEQLRNIAWTQSHVLRAPLARLLGLIELLQTVDTEVNELPFFLDQIKLAAEEMDEVVRSIVKETQTMGLNPTHS